MKLLRLLPSTPESWFYFPHFKLRVQEFLQRFLPETNANLFLQEAEQRWINTPQAAGYWIALDENQTPFAHALAWFAAQYGRPFIFIHQVWVDDKRDAVHEEIAEALPLVDAFFLDVETWKAELNRLIPAGQPQVEETELSTFRKPEVWLRYFKQRGYKSVVVRTQIRFGKRL